MGFRSPFVRQNAWPRTERSRTVGWIGATVCGLVLLAVPFAGRADAQQLRFRQYSQDQGLLNLGINCLTQDGDGFMYACTAHGLVRYNGVRFAKLDPAAGVPDAGIVRGFDVAPNGRMYATFSDAVYVADQAGNHRSWDHTRRFSKVGMPDGPIDVDVNHQTALLGNDLLLVERGQLSVVRTTTPGTAAVQAFFDQATLAAYPALRRVRSVFVDKNVVWLGCGADAVCRIASGVVTVLGPKNGLPPDSWSSFFRDRNGVMWARSLNWIAHQLPGAARFQVEPVPGGAGRYAGRSDRLTLAESPDGRLMTQGANGLLVRTDGRWTVLGRHNGMPVGSATVIFFDQEGSLWLGIRDEGVFRSQGYGLWENWNSEDGLSDNVVWQMSRRKDGPLWVASEGGVDALPTHGMAPPRLSHLDGSSFAVAAIGGDRIWRGTVDGAVERADSRSGEIDHFSVPPLNGILHGRDGRLWFFTEDGLFLQADPDAAVPTPPVRIAGIPGHVRAMTEDAQGSIWLIAGNALLRRGIKGDLHVVLDASREAGYKTRALTVPSPGTVWLGGVLGGIRQLHVEDDHVTATSFITTPTIGSESLQFLQCDSRGWIWAGTDRGLDVFNGHAWRHVDEADGLLSNDLDEGAVLEDEDGSMWFGTGRGVSHLLRPESLFEARPLRPIITDASASGLPLPERAISGTRAPLVISFSALNFRIEHSIRFRYRLEGIDSDWVETSSRDARYPVLPPGRHWFSVVAFDPDTREVSQPISVLVRIRTPTWRQWPMLVLYGVLALGILATGLRLRVRYLIRRQRHLEALVAARTQEIDLARLALQHQATHDGLTGLSNRMAILEALDASIEQAAFARASFAIGLIDLDHFKAINDGYGHLAGDAVLREIGLRLRDALGPTEQAGRYGGEELLLIVPGDEDLTCERILRMRDHVTGRVVVADARAISVTCSVGVAWFQPDDSAESLIDRADKALYAAKNSGRNRIVYGFNS